MKHGCFVWSDTQHLRHVLASYSSIFLIAPKALKAVLIRFLISTVSSTVLLKKEFVTEAQVCNDRFNGFSIVEYSVACSTDNVGPDHPSLR